MSEISKRRLLKFGIWAAILLAFFWLTSLRNARDISTFRSSSNWISFAPEGARFNVLMPGKPQRLRRDVVDQTSGVTFTWVLYSSSDGATTFTIGYFDYPSEVIRKYSPDELIAASRENLRRERGAPKTDRPIVAAGVPAREMVFTEQRETSRIRFFVVGNRAYQLIATTRGNSESRDQVTQFFNSFKFTK